MLSDKTEVKERVFGRIFSRKGLHGEYATQLQSAAVQILFWKHLKHSQKPVCFVFFKFHDSYTVLLWKYPALWNREGFI